MKAFFFSVLVVEAFAARSPGWSVPLVGLSSNISTPWGANLTQFRQPIRRALPAVEPERPFPIAIPYGESTMSFFPGYVNASGTKGNLQNVTLAFDTDSNDLYLGIGLNFNISEVKTVIPSPSLILMEWPTIPFGINVGQNGSWNGSLAFGGYYDAARVEPGNWFALFDAAANDQSKNKTTWGLGEFPLGNLTMLLYPYDTELTHPTTPYPNSLPPTVFNFTNAYISYAGETIRVPAHAASLCGANNTMILAATTNATASPEWPLPASLTPASRCVVDTTIPDDTLFLGKPFFQATYLYIDANFTHWAAPAQSYDAPPQLVAFDAAAPLAPVLPPGAPEQSESVWRIALGASLGGLAVIVLATFAGWWWVQRRARHVAEAGRAKQVEEGTD